MIRNPDVINFSIGERLLLTTYSVVAGVPILNFVETYIFNDWGVLVNIALLMFLDTFFGSWAAIKDGTFSATEGLRKFLVKTFTMLGILLCVGTLTLASTEGGQILGVFFKNGAFAIVIAFEAISVLRNIYKVRPYGFIERIINMIKKIVNQE